VHVKLGWLPVDSGLARSTRKQAVLRPPRIDSIIRLHFRKATDMATTNTVRLHRVLRAKPERLYKAFLDAEAMAKWLPPYGFTCKVHELNAKVGGTFRMSFSNFTTNTGHSFGGE